MRAAGRIGLPLLLAWLWACGPTPAEEAVAAVRSRRGEPDAAVRRVFATDVRGADGRWSPAICGEVRTGGRWAPFLYDRRRGAELPDASGCAGLLAADQ